MKFIPSEVEQVANRDAEDRQQALRALLRHPLIVADDPELGEDFARIRRHGDSLRAWFSLHTGWSLDITAECARLYKVPGRLTDSTRGAVSGKEGSVFNQRRYILFCLALAVLVRGESQITLGELAQAIVRLWMDEESLNHIAFDLEAVDSRRDLVAAVRLLLTCNALGKVDGDDQRFIQSQKNNALYDVRHHVIYRLLSARRPPSMIKESGWRERLAALADESKFQTGEQRNLQIRHEINRRLLDDPLLYLPGDLSQDAQEYFAKQRPFIIKALEEATGMEIEDRRDGIALSDRYGDCTDIGLPEEGTDGHATLLTAEYLGRLRHERPGEIIPFAVVEQFLAEQAQQFRKFWRRDATAPGGEQALAREVLHRLESLDLVRRFEHGVLPMAAIHRYRHELRSRTVAAPETE
ncbi:MAG: TIGR02678 family protein [Chthoniobacter sp.]